MTGVAVAFAVLEVWGLIMIYACHRTPRGSPTWAELWYELRRRPPVFPEARVYKR